MSALQLWLDRTARARAPSSAFWQDWPLPMRVVRTASTALGGVCPWRRSASRSYSRIQRTFGSGYETAMAYGKVIVLADGRIVEEGPPRDLTSDGTAFFRMFLSQP